MQREAIAAPSREGRESVHELAAWVLQHVDEVAEDLTDRIYERVTALEDDMRPATVASCRANVAFIASLLDDELQPRDLAVPPEALFYARETARRQLGLDGLLQAYRVAHGLFMRIVLQHLEAENLGREALAQTSTFLSDWMFDWMDDVLATVAGAWADEREQWVRTSSAIRAESVAAILAGNPIDVAETSTRLAYDLDLRHVAFIVWAEPSEIAETGGDFEDVATSLVKRLGGRSSLLVQQGSTRLDGWMAVHDEDIPAIADGRLPAAAKSGARIAIGSVGTGVQGFRQSHEDALAVQRLASLARRPTGAALRFDDVVLDALLTRDRRAAERFVTMQLGGLTAPDDAVRRVAATLRVFLEEGGSFTRAARRIGVHENTVAYRVRRAEELLGRPLDQRKLEIHVALRLADLLRRTGPGE